MQEVQAGEAVFVLLKPIHVDDFEKYSLVLFVFTHEVTPEQLEDLFVEEQVTGEDETVFVTEEITLVLEYFGILLRKALQRTLTVL